MEKILERYERYSYAERQLIAPESDVNTNWSMEYNRLKAKIDLLERNQRHYLGEDLQAMSSKELQNLEQQLDTALKHIRSRKNQLMYDSINELQRKEKAIQEQNSMLSKEIKEREKILRVQQEQWDQQNHGHNMPPPPPPQQHQIQHPYMLSHQPSPFLNMGGLYQEEDSMAMRRNDLDLSLELQEKAFEIPQLNDESISSKDLENHLQWEKSVNCRAVLEALASNLKEPTRRRKPQLTKTQVWPFVRNSTVKRIISGEKVSKEPYDPLAKVEAEKLHKVLDFINSDLEAKEPGVGDESAGFFLKLLIPRDDWPTKDYGWLNDSHIAEAMLMFHKRSKQEQSPYSSSRIAFLSHWFVNSWVNDYKSWDQNTELSEMYIKAFNGEHPADFVTGNKWIADVDDLFLCHHVNGDHWVPLRIELHKGKIHVYDSICTHESDKEMKEACRP
ncbi:unnamed protein product, partial [Brassica napus]